MIKKCPRCGANHKKKGTYCSRSCANVRTHTQADKDIQTYFEYEGLVGITNIDTRAVVK